MGLAFLRQSSPCEFNFAAAPFGLNTSGVTFAASHEDCKIRFSDTQYRFFRWPYSGVLRCRGQGHATFQCNSFMNPSRGYCCKGMSAPRATARMSYRTAPLSATDHRSRSECASASVESGGDSSAARSFCNIGFAHSSVLATPYT